MQSTDAREALSGHETRLGEGGGGDCLSQQQAERCLAEGGHAGLRQVLLERAARLLLHEQPGLGILHTFEHKGLTFGGAVHADGNVELARRWIGQEGVPHAQYWVRWRAHCVCEC